MKQNIALAFIISIFCTSLSAQEMWTDHSATAKNRAYWGVSIDWVSVKSGNVFSFAPEYGRVLHKYFSVGISGRMIWYATPESGVAFNIHPYAKLHTSFPHPLPNLYAEIGYDFRLRSYDDQATAPAYYQDFGIRPGIDICLSPKVHLFIQFTFTGYQWSLVNGRQSSSWKLFRSDSTDRLIGVSIYY